MQQIDQRIIAIIQHFKLNNYAFSKRIGVTSTTIDSIVNGRPQKDGSRKKTKPGYDVLSAIINTFNINTDYLFGKSDLMIKGSAMSQSYSGVPKVISVNKENEENIIYVPAKARAGYLDGFDDQEYIESLPSFNMPQLTNGTFRSFEVQGNSMLPTFNDGDMVFGKYVENLSDIKNGHVYVIISKNDGVVLKRVINTIEIDGKLILKSDNKDGDYPNYTIDANNIMEIWYVTLFASKQMAEPIDVYNRLHTLETKFSDLQETVKTKVTKH